MSEVKYSIKKNQKPTEDQIREVMEAAKQAPVYDSECPFVDPEKTPLNYKAMMKAVAERNKSFSERLA